uniref:Uncharacterized protein n=2 Tax=Ceratitis capitata TaxID=7213 RepID=W8BYI0_CERCA
MDKMHSSIEKGSENKYLLKRRSKLDSIIEIEKFSIQQPNKLQEQLMNQSVRAEDIDDDNICCLDTEENESSNKIGSSKLTQNSLNLSEKKNETGLPSNALELVIEKYTLDELLEKYLDCGKDTKLKHYNTIAKTMSKGMSDNSKIKEGILEALSENHSKDFLDHAIRENLASVVCDRLNLPSVIEYVCEKSKINTACRANLFAQIPDILKHCKQDAERLKVLQTMFGSSSLKDSDILDLIQTLLRMRSMDKTMSVTVSEAAIDSSSNL